jgi:hypothetical protein
LRFTERKIYIEKFRIENTLTDEKGDEVELKESAELPAYRIPPPDSKRPPATNGLLLNCSQSLKERAYVSGREVSPIRVLFFRDMTPRVSLSKRQLLLAAAFCNVLIIVLCFAVYGLNTEGAGATTRNTARFAICFFLAGFAAPGLRKWLRWYPDSAILIRAFVAAQMVHFCSVIALHTRFAPGPLHLGTPQIAVVLAGFTIVLGAGLTATPRAQSRIYGAAHVVFLYLIWLILAADYPKHPIKSLRLVEILVVLALVLRHLPRRHANAPDSSTHNSKPKRLLTNSPFEPRIP